MAEETKAELPPGRELDKQITWEVFGFDVSEDMEEVPHYSTDIAAAWQVLEHFIKNKFLVTMGILTGEGWRCVIIPPRLGEEWASGYSNSASHAICLAALKAKAKEKEKEQKANGNNDQ